MIRRMRLFRFNGRNQAAIRRVLYPSHVQEGFNVRQLKKGRPEIVNRILVVEDDRFCQSLWLLDAKKLGLTVECFVPKNTESLWEKVRQYAPQLIIMDNNLGWEVATGTFLTRFLREKGWGGFIVAYSADGNHNRRMLEFGADIASPKDIPLVILERLLVL